MKLWTWKAIIKAIANSIILTIASMLVIGIIFFTIFIPTKAIVFDSTLVVYELIVFLGIMSILCFIIYLFNCLSLTKAKLHSQILEKRIIEAEAEENKFWIRHREYWKIQETDGIIDIIDK